MRKLVLGAPGLEVLSSEPRGLARCAVERVLTAFAVGCEASAPPRAGHGLVRAWNWHVSSPPEPRVAVQRGRAPGGCSGSALPQSGAEAQPRVAVSRRRSAASRRRHEVVPRSGLTQLRELAAELPSFAVPRRGSRARLRHLRCRTQSTGS